VDEAHTKSEGVYSKSGVLLVEKNGYYFGEMREEVVWIWCKWFIRQF